MSLVTGGGVKLFPREWIEECIKTYTKERGKAPKVLVLNPDDHIDYTFSATIGQAEGLGVTTITGEYLKPGEIDLAQGVVEPNKTKKKNKK